MRPWWKEALVEKEQKVNRQQKDDSKGSTAKG